MSGDEEDVVPTPAAQGSEVARLRQQLAALSNVSQAIAQAQDLNALLDAIYRETSHVLDTTCFISGLYDEPSNTVHVIKHLDSGVEYPGGSFPVGTGFTSQAIRTRLPLLIRHWSVDGPRVQIQGATDQPGLPESGITVPLLQGERVIGVLSVQSYRPEAYDEDDLLTLQVIASQAAVAIEYLRRSERLDALLQRRVSELEAILASMGDALLIVDTADRIVQLNDAARKLLALDTSDVSIVVGQPLDRERWGLWPLGARAIAEALSPLIEALRRGEPLHEIEVELRGDGRRVLSFNGAPLRNADGELTGGVILFRDVTGRREVERLKDEILAIASHDLKTPVAAIKGQAQLLSRRIATQRATPEALANGLETIVRQADRVAHLLNLLLDLSRLEAGRLELQPKQTDLVALVRGVIEALQATTDRHRFVLRTPEMVEGTWDERRLEQVLQNLLNNAVKYSPGGGIVEVVVEADEETARVRVRDEGMGLAPEELPQIFERYYRAEGARRLEGAGLGLYICQGIVSAHGGRIWAESAGPGRGSTFCFSLPRAAPALQERGPRSELAPDDDSES